MSRYCTGTQSICWNTWNWSNQHWHWAFFSTFFSLLAADKHSLNQNLNRHWTTTKRKKVFCVVCTICTMKNAISSSCAVRQNNNNNNSKQDKLKTTNIFYIWFERLKIVLGKVIYVQLYNSKWCSVHNILRYGILHAVFCYSEICLFYFCFVFCCRTHIAFVCKATSCSQFTFNDVFSAG